MYGVPTKANDLKFINSIEGYKGSIQKLGRLLAHVSIYFADSSADCKSHALRFAGVVHHHRREKLHQRTILLPLQVTYSRLQGQADLRRPLHLHSQGHPQGKALHYAAGGANKICDAFSVDPVAVVFERVHRPSWRMKVISGIRELNNRLLYSAIFATS